MVPGNTRNQRGDCSKGGVLAPSALVRRFASKIASSALDMPILDVGCGSGRNAFFIARLGCALICLDKDLSPLNQGRASFGTECRLTESLAIQKIDLLKEPWPCELSSVGGIINVHCFLPTLFPFFANSLRPGGYLLLETPPACGGNFRELPKTGELKAVLEKWFEFDLYRERPAGPRKNGAVAVQIVAKRREERP
jgi:SAM-dependent methyltransferase